MFSKKLAAAAAVVAATAIVAPAAHARENPLPPGACVTRGAAGLAYDVGVNCRTVEHDGIDRRYIVYVPHHPIPTAGAPVVMMFHGTGGNGAQFLKISGWREQAERTGLVAVFPTGLRYRVTESGRLKTKWNEFGLAGKIDLEERPRGYPEDSPMPADDVGFVDAIMADVGAQLPIDRHRVYASGFSNGASFTARLSVERSNQIAAAAYSAGGLLRAQDAPDRAVPTYVSLGTRDDRVLEGTGLTELPLNPVEILTSRIVTPLIRANLRRSASTRTSSARSPARARRRCAGPRPGAVPAARCSSSGCSPASSTSTPTAATTRRTSKRPPSSGTSSRTTRCRRCISAAPRAASRARPRRRGCGARRRWRRPRSRPRRPPAPRPGG